MKLRHLEEWTEQRRAAARDYREFLGDLPEEERATMARRVDIVVFPTGGEL